MDPSPYDAIARRVLMAALLRYGLEIEAVSESHYARWCRRLAANWESISLYRRWQLRFPEDLEEAGGDFRITMGICYGAQDWANELKLLRGQLIIEVDEWRWSKKHLAHYLYPEEFELYRRPRKKG